MKVAFYSQPRQTLDNVFLSLQMTMTDVLRYGGGNDYVPKHTGKAKLQRQGLLPTSINCDPALIESGMKLLRAGVEEPSVKEKGTVEPAAASVKPAAVSTKKRKTSSQASVPKAVPTRKQPKRGTGGTRCSPRLRSSDPTTIVEGASKWT